MRAQEFLTEYRHPNERTVHKDGLDLESIIVGRDFQITASSQGRELGRVLFHINDNTLIPDDLWVEEQYRGQGIAAVMYDWAKELGYRIERSDAQTDAGKHFWDKNRGSQRVWESKTLDTDLYGEELPRPTVRKIVTNIMKQVDPSAKVKVGYDWGYYLVTTDNDMLRFDFGITADGGEISANIVNAYSSYKGAGVVTRIIAECFKAAEQLWGKPTKFVISTQQDRGDGVWQAIAQKLGAEWGGSAMESVNEIARLPKKDAGDFGDKGTIVAPTHAVKKTPLPGGSRFTYAVNKTGTGDIEIMIFDGETLAAEMDLFDTQDFMKTWRVETVVVDPDYRGQGLGKALYGIALSILKLTVEAGETQTQHGQQMWLMLNSIPGVEVVGYNMEPTDKYQPKPGDKVVDQNTDWTRYTFPVTAGSRSMRSGRRGTGIYTSQASMIAKWTGR